MEMEVWRMAMRVGAGGENLWPACKESQVAAITYDLIHTEDLSTLDENERPESWSGLLDPNLGA
jgi:hypothetical protein